jgi:type II secretory pathway component PulK
LHSSRRGAATLFLIICLAVLGVVCAAMCRAIALDERIGKHERCRAQAWWLAEAGLERALARLKSEPNYAGEVWSIAAADLGAADDAVVNIQVRSDAADGARREIVAVADYHTGTLAVRQTRTISINLEPKGNNP